MSTETKEFQVASEICDTHEPGFYYANWAVEPDEETIIEIRDGHLLWHRHLLANVYRWRIIGPVPTTVELEAMQDG